MTRRARAQLCPTGAGLSRRTLLAATLLGAGAAQARGLWREVADAPGWPADLPVSNLQTGDLIFHTSRSNQSNAIMWATASPYSHCGLVRVYRGDAFVIEASRTVRVVGLDAWIRRGQLGRFKVLRDASLSRKDQLAVWKAAKRYRGRPYDSLFLFGNRAIYCSELCWLAYKDALDVELGTVQPVSDLNVQGPLVEAVFKGRWRRHPSCRGLNSAEACKQEVLAQELITPAALVDDARLSSVYSNYPPLI